MKTCTYCHETKPLEEFNLEPRCKTDGRTGRCKACRRLVRQQNADKKRAYDAEYREKHREKIQKYHFERYHKNRESRINAAREWQQLNPELTAWYKKQNKYKRRAAVNNSSLTTSELAVWESQELKICAYCGNECTDHYQIDHIEPLSKGGLHELHNLAIACPTCNRRKSDKPLIVFMAMNY